MTSNRLEAEVTLDVDDDPVDEAIEAVNELEEALTRLESRGISVEVSGPASDQYGETVGIDYDAAGEIGDLASEAIAEMHGVDSERVKIFEIIDENALRKEKTDAAVRSGLLKALNRFFPERYED